MCLWLCGCVHWHCGLYAHASTDRPPAAHSTHPSYIQKQKKASTRPQMGMTNAQSLRLRAWE